MDKEYAIEFVREHGVVALVTTLFSNGDDASAENILENCWGYSDDEVADFIEDNWNF